MLNNIFKKTNWADIKKIFLIVLFWRILLLVFVGILSLLIPASGSDAVPLGVPKVLGPFAHWDARFYLEIIRNGYGSNGSALPVFFPLFPALVSIFSFNEAYTVLVGVIINFIATFGATYFLYKLAIDYSNDKIFAKRTIEIFLFFPTALFMSVFYSEAIFCFFAFGAFYYARKRNWLVSNIMLAFVTASRLVGVIVALAVFVEYMNSIDFNIKKINLKILYFLISPLGILIYMLYLNNLFNDPFYFKTAYKYGWAERNQFKPNIIKTIYDQTKYLVNLALIKSDGWLSSLFYGSLGYLSWIAAFLIGLNSYKKIPISYSVYLFLGLFLFLSQGVFDSIFRYALVLFPLFIIIAKFFKKHEDYFFYYLCISLTLLLLVSALFSNGTWIG